MQNYFKCFGTTKILTILSLKIHTLKKTARWFIIFVNIIIMCDICITIDVFRITIS